jgi:hypothetical protein
MRALPAAALSLLISCAIAFAQAPVAPVPAYRVIVHISNRATQLERGFVADALLKKVSRWPGGQTIRPVDLAADSPVRRKLSEELLDRSVAAVRSYWQQLIFSGRDVPPPELESDDAVVKYVAQHAGGIGYVSGGANLDGVRAVTLR